MDLWIKKKVYHLKDYNISYDIGSGDQSSLVIAKLLNGTIYVLETFYNEQATLLATILDSFQLESKRLANQNEALYGELELLKQKYAEMANLLHEKYFEGNCPKIIDMFDKLNKAEIERLNNIITKIEEDLTNRYYGLGEHSTDTYSISIKEVLKNIQELKRSKL